jgi:hypothetical protein
MRTVTWQVGSGTLTTLNISDTATATEVRQIIQSALDAAAEAASDSQPATVTLSAGIFVVDGTGTASQGCLRVKSNVTFQGSQDGQGNWSKIDLDDSYSGAVTGIVRTPNNYAPSGEDPIHNVTIRNLVIEGIGTAASENVDGVCAGNYSGDPNLRDPARSQYNITIENANVSNCSRYGIDPHEQISNLTISNCVSHDNGKDGFTLDYVEGGTLTNNLAYSNGRHGFNLVTGTHDVVMTDNVARDNGLIENGSGIVVQPPSADNDPRVRYSYDILITRGAVYNNYDVGIRIANGARITVEDINIYDHAAYGILITIQTRYQGEPVIPDATDFFLISNHVHDNGLFADDGAEIRISDDVDDVTILGNRIGAAGTTDYMTGANLGVLTIDGNRYEKGVIVANTYGSVTFPDNPATIGSINFFNFGNGSNSVNYFAGRQYVKGNGGDDTISTGADKDTLLGNAGNDSLNGGDDRDVLSGGSGDDTLDGGAGADKMHGGLGDDVFIADNASDQVVEAPDSGTDVVQTSVTYSLANVSNVENLVLTGSAAIDGTGNGLVNTINGNSAANSISGGAGADYIVAASGADTVSGGNGADSIFGGNGNDPLNGNGGDDRITSGGGIDTLTGAGANDTFVFNALGESGVGAGNRTIITDFSTISGNDDIIDVSSIDANTGVAGNQAFARTGTAAFTAAGQARHVVQGGNTIVQFNVDANTAADLEIQLTGTPALTAGEFIL